MSGDDYHIVGYEERYRDGVLDLLTPLWGHDLERKRACLRWKYDGNPYGPPLILVVLYHERPVAVRAFVPTCWQEGSTGKRCLCVADADAVVHPEHRRRGLLKRMTHVGLKELEKLHFEQVVTIGAAPESAGNNLGMGWSMPGMIGIMHRSGGTEHTALHSSEPGWLRRIARRIPGLSPALRHIVSRYGSSRTDREAPFQQLDLRLGSRRPGDPVIMSREPDTELMAEMVTDRATRKISHIRDREYVAWRYRNPLAAYRFLYPAPGRGRGYLVLQRPLQNPSGPVSIVDWEAEDPQVFGDLVRTALREGGFEGVEIWSSSLSDSERNTLAGLGFRERTSTGEAVTWPVLVRPLADRKPMIGSLDMLELGAWELRGIFSDCY